MAATGCLELVEMNIRMEIPPAESDLLYLKSFCVVLTGHFPSLGVRSATSTETTHKQRP